MTTQSRLTHIWLTLVLLTLVTALAGYYNWSGVYIVGFLLLTVIIKGQLIIDYFMGLKNVGGLWRYAMLAFVMVVSGFIFTGYVLS